MPTCLSAILNQPSKRFRLSLLILFSPLYFFGQTTLTGLWIGAFSNDSTTIRKEQSFEIALTEYRGKVFGYSRSEFIVNDTLYYVVKRVKGTINGDVCEVKDDEIVAFNFPTKLDKGVKVTSFFYRNKVDSTWHLAGNWKTNQTKHYYSVTGKIDLAEEKDLTASKLFPHLEELNLSNDIAFYKDRKKHQPVMRDVESEAKLFSAIQNERISSIAGTKTPNGLNDEVEINTVSVSNTTILRTQTNASKASALEIPVKTETAGIIAQVKDGPAKEKSTVGIEAMEADKNYVQANPTSETVKINTPSINSTNVVRTNASVTKTTALEIPVKTDAENKTAQVKSIPERERTKIKTETQPGDQSVAQKPAAKPQSEIVKTNNPAVSQTNVIRTNPELKKSENKNITVKTETVTAKSNVPVETKKQPETQPVVATITTPQKSLEEIIAPAKSIGGRNSEFTQTVNFKSDSLQLSLYDNGEIDGDTVSLYMNGQPMLVKQGLKASAIKKTIYLSEGSNDEFTLVLYAENLGKYPPNTGLLVVRDGEDVYNVRFSADYQKNSGVVFRRKK